MRIILFLMCLARFTGEQRATGKFSNTERVTLHSCVSANISAPRERPSSVPRGRVSAGRQGTPFSFESTLAQKISAQRHGRRHEVRFGT